MEKLGPNSANSTPLTPLIFLERAATVAGDSPSIVYNKTVYTWAQTYRRCLRLASALSRHLHISSGDVVSVISPNTPAMYEMHFGVPMSGAVLNTINIRLDARTISALLRHSSSRVLFADKLFLPLARSAVSLLPDPPLLLPIDEPSTVSVSVYSNDPLNLRTHLLSKYTLTHLTYESLLSLGDHGFQWVRPSTEWAAMVLNYTSGTTSSPKGVVHSHRSVFLAAVNSLTAWPLPLHPVYLWTLPMFHANGWCYPWAIAAAAGTNICLRSFDGPAIFDAIAENRVTHLCAAPVVLAMLADTSRVLPNQVQILTAGSPPPAAVLRRVEAIGFVVTHSYGLTETGSFAVSCAWKGGEWNGLPEEERAVLKSRQGVRTAVMEAADVVDETGESVARDGETRGVVVLRGGYLMMGYLGDDEATSAAVKGGWFYTGDVAVVHPDGYMEIKDRLKDVIISGGENISSVEVESVMYGHPAVAEVAVVARPDEHWGETPCAFVKVKPGVMGAAPPTEAEMIAWCRERMPHYIVPKTVVFLPELPKTSTGKIQKYILKNNARELCPPAAGVAAVLPTSRM